MFGKVLHVKKVFRFWYWTPLIVNVKWENGAESNLECNWSKNLEIKYCLKFKVHKFNLLFT